MLLSCFRHHATRLPRTPVTYDDYLRLPRYALLRRRQIFTMPFYLRYADIAAAPRYATLITPVALMLCHIDAARRCLR